METQVINKKRNKFISKPLFVQTFKSSWVLWLVMALGSGAIFFVINLALGSKDIFTNIDMGTVTTYVRDEELSWPFGWAGIGRRV